MKNTRRYTVLAAAIAAAGITSKASAGSFVPGGLVLMEVGTANQFFGGDAVSFIEIDPATGATLASPGTISLPTSGPNAMSEPDSTNHDRHLELSTDGHYLAFSAYNIAPGPTDPSTLPANAADAAASGLPQVPRVVGLLTADGSADLSTRLTDAYNGTSIRGAFTTNGTDIWTSGDNASGATGSGGTHYTTRGSSTSSNISSVQTLGSEKTPDNIRDARVFNGQLYVTSGSDASVGKGFLQAGTGTPTSGAQTLTTLFHGDSTSAIYFLDTNHDGVLDTAYTGTSTGNGLRKYSLIGDTWTEEGLISTTTGSTDQITALENPNGSVTVYFGDTAAIYKYTDPTPYGVSLPSIAATPLLTLPDDAAVTLGGFDFAPTPVGPANEWKTSGGGSWAGAGNWSNATVPSGVGDTATFASAGSGTVTLDTNRTVGHLVFDNAASYNLAGGGFTLTINNGNGVGAAGIPSIAVNQGSHTISAPVMLANAVRVTTALGSSLAIAGAVSGVGGFYTDGLGTVTLSAPATYSGDTTDSSGILTIAGTGSLPTTTNLISGDGDLHTTATVNIAASTTASTPRAVTLASVTINDNGSVQLLAPGTHGGRSVLVTSGLTLAGGINAWQGELDMTGNDMIVKNGVVTNIANQLKAGFNAHNGYWNGASGIISSAAAGNSHLLTTLGYRTGGSAFNSAPGSPFDGVNTSSSDVLVKYTYYGDANLDGVVNGGDYHQIDVGFGMHLTGWSNGDFNYDGVVDGSDYSLIDNTFNQISATGANPLAIIASAAVPEPTTLGLLWIGAMGLLGRRRRRNV
jgi:hypothetical protein